QAQRLFPDVEWREIRGNVDTRLRKIANGEADGTILAAAGLSRLEIHSWPGVTFRLFSTREMVPAVGQGAIAVQCRVNAAGMVSQFLDAPAALAVTVERAVLEQIGGGCNTAFAAHFSDGQLEVFHEKVGHRQFGLPDVKTDEAAEAVKPIVEELR